MTLFSLAAHLLAWALPALALALVGAPLARWLVRPLARPARWRGLLGAGVLAGLAVLALGLLLTGHDGRMWTYAALAPAVAAAQCGVARRGRRLKNQG